MNRIKLLWELESHNVNLTDILNKIENLNKGLEKEDTDKKIKKLIRRLEILDNNKGVIKTHIAKFENSLSQYEYEIAAINDKLYKENITDIKQLEYLGFEKEQLNNKLKEVETDMIAYMEEQELLDTKHCDAECLLKELSKNSDDQFDVIKKDIKELEEKSKEVEAKIKEITGKLDDEILAEYNDLIRRKDKPIVLIVNQMCSGCNMKLPTYQLEELKVKDQIVNCESCGRILYSRD